jgi:hypothetical protein
MAIESREGPMLFAGDVIKLIEYSISVAQIEEVLDKVENFKRIID